MIGHVLWAVYPPVRGSEVEIRFRDAVARKAPVHFETVSAITGRWIEVHGYPIDEGLSVFFRDISERKRAEQQLRGDRERLAGIVAEQNAELSDSQQRLRLSERMVMIGTLAAGLAHDLANLIMPIRLCLHSLEKQDLPPAARDDLQTIGKSADYLQSLAAGLRQVARDPNGTPTAGKGTTLNQWWSEVSPLLRAVLPRHVRLDSALADDSTVLAVPGPRLTQAVLNLVQNAGDALSSARNGWVRLTLDTGSSPDFVILRVIDNGPGMTPDVRRRCMEPFYTTKTRGPGGTGLGLALVHRIVTDAGGEIGVQSGENEGTTFELKLPVSRT